MGLRVRKRIKLGKGLYLNVGKNGISTSVKIGNTTLNSRGRVTSSIPGTGISYTQNLNKHNINTNHINKKPSMLSIIFWTIIFFPIGIYKLIRRLTF